MDMKIATIRFEYVGLPLARLFATQNPVVGFGSHAERVEKWMPARDQTLEENGKLWQAVMEEWRPASTTNILSNSDLKPGLNSPANK